MLMPRTEILKPFEIDGSVGRTPLTLDEGGGGGGGLGYLQSPSLFRARSGGEMKVRRGKGGMYQGWIPDFFINRGYHSEEEKHCQT